MCGCRTRTARDVGGGGGDRASEKRPLCSEFGLAQLKILGSEQMSVLVEGIKRGGKGGHYHGLWKHKAAELRSNNNEKQKGKAHRSHECNPERAGPAISIQSEQDQPFQ